MVPGSVAIDFPDGAHGHFLDTIINKFIFNIDSDVGDVFNKVGAAHNFNSDSDYMNGKIACCNHYSDHNILLDKVEKIIVIDVPEKYEFIRKVNSFNRSQPQFLKTEEIYNWHKSELKAGTEQELRLKWYDQLQRCPQIYNPKINVNNVPEYKFKFEALFNLADFIEELNIVARFLTRKLTVNKDLINAWNKFIAVNDGYRMYNIAQSVLDDIINNENHPVPNNWQLHAYLNLRITNIFDIWDGKLFELETYPINTNEVHNIIQEQINEEI